MTDRERVVVDATPVIVRHVRRAQDGELAVEVLGAAFHAAAGAELDAFNGEAGWQSAQATDALADDGDLTITLPNAAGDDGILHRRRFALLTDPLYRMGEEWLEVYREPLSAQNLLGTFTPTRWRMDRSSLQLSGPNVPALFTLARASELDLWHHAPRDVFEHYTQLPVADLAADLTGWSTAGSGSAGGWSWADLIAPGATPGARLSSGSSTPATLEHAIGAAGEDAFEVAARLLWEAPTPSDTTQEVRLVVDFAGAALELRYTPSDGTVILAGVPVGAGVWRAGGRTQQTKPGGCSLRLLVRREWVYAFVEGELVAHARRSLPLSTPTAMRVEARNATVVAQRFDAQSLAPFALRGADPGDRHLPGVPTPGGLRGRYWNEAAPASVVGSTTSDAYLAAVLDDLVDPGDSRLDATLDFAGSSWQPPAAQPSSGAWSARWTGAIYLDLSIGRAVRLAALDGAARVWIGRTLRAADAVIDAWVGGAGARTDLRSGDLAELGPSGWYPIVVELANDGGDAAIHIEESALDGAGAPTAWATVPAAHLSPLGVLEQEVRMDSHRELLDSITQAFGYQWRVEPRTLESGEFPAQLIPRVRVGTDTDRIVPSDRAAELASEGDATDAVDRLLIDAAGLADPKSGADSLTADVVNDVAVDAGHLFLSTGTESLPDVTEPNLLAQRADSLIALKATPNEQIAARPMDAGDALTDTFPLTGALARRRWRPGDGLRLALEDLSVIDLTPRQLIAVQLPLWRDGTGVPTVGWRQRPRGIRAFLKRTARVAFAGQRNPQGQTGLLTGSWGSLAGPDAYSRIPLPDDLARVATADLVVEVLAGAGVIEVNGTSTGIAVDAVGRYPIDRFVARYAGAPRLVARIAGATAYEVHLELRVRL